MFPKPMLEEGAIGEEGVGIEEESVDERAYESLLSDIKKLSGKKRVGVISSVRFSTRPTDGIQAGDILKVLANDRLQNASKKVRALAAPLEKGTAKRIRRMAGFDTVAVEVGKWESLIHSRRNADQLNFPLENTSVKVEAVNKVTSLKPRTELEHDVYSLLKGAQLIDDKKETPEEEARRKAMSLDEVWERNQEIMRERLVRQRWERKAALQNKSKSKNFHRILRRERLRKQKVELEALQKADPTAALEKLQELENARIRERIDLRHRQSRWAHLRSLRAKDPSAIAALQENARLHEELKQKLKLKPLNDDLSASDEEEAEVIMKEGTYDPDNPWTSELRKGNGKSEMSKDMEDGFTNFKKFWDEFNQRKAEEKARSIEGDCNQQQQMRENMNLVQTFRTNEKTERGIILEQRENTKDGRNEKNVVGVESLKAETRKNDKMNKKKIVNKDLSFSLEADARTNDNLKKTKSSKKKNNPMTCKKMDAFSYTSESEVNDPQKENCNGCENWKNGTSSDYRIGVGKNGKQSNKAKRGSKKISASANVDAVTDKLKKNKSSKKAKKYQTSKAVSATAALSKTCNKESRKNVDVDGQDVDKSSAGKKASTCDCKSEEKNGKFLSQMRNTMNFQGSKINVAVENERKDTDLINSRQKASKKIRSIKKFGKNVEETESFKHNEEKIKKSFANIVKEKKQVKLDPKNVNQLVKYDSDDDYFVDVAFEKAGSKASKAVQEKLKVVETELRIIAESQMPVMSQSEKIRPMRTMDYDFTFHDKEETLNEGLMQLRTEEEIEALQEIAEGISAKKGAVIFSAIKDDIVKEAKCDHSTSPGAKQMTTGSVSEEAASSYNKKSLTDVDPTNFIQVPCKKLKTALPDTVKGHSWSDDGSEGLEEEDSENVLQEAFADDYSLMDFKSEKQASKSDLLKDLDDTLPGWGSWTGPGTKASKKRAKKIKAADLIVNAKMPPNKFDGQENVIYSEGADMHSNLRALMVNELPHPFVRVRDFESSIRAPVGRAFVPENVHHKLIAPPIVTKMGTVIPPIDESALLQSGCG